MNQLLGLIFDETDKINNSHILTKKYQQLETYYDLKYNALWCVFDPQPAPVFTLTLLQNIRTIQDLIATVYFENPNHAPKYIIWLSSNPQVFSLGIDLDYVSQLIICKDSRLLNEYLQLCMDVFYINLMKLDIRPAITISLVRGKAYGGGFEAALTCDVIFAESGANCCFPEIHYNLLPSLGTISMLMRRFNDFEIEELIFEGKHLSLEALHKMSLITKIAPVEKGIEYIHKFIQTIHPKHRAFSYLYSEKSKSIIVSNQELSEFKRLWLDAALNLRGIDIRRLVRLGRAQCHLQR